MSELRECPFCKSAQVVYAYRQRGMPCWVYFVRCQNCDAHGPEGESDSEARELWNQREGPKVTTVNEAQIDPYPGESIPSYVKRIYQCLNARIVKLEGTK